MTTSTPKLDRGEKNILIRKRIKEFFKEQGLNQRVMAYIRIIVRLYWADDAERETGIAEEKVIRSIALAYDLNHDNLRSSLRELRDKAIVIITRDKDKKLLPGVELAALFSELRKQ